MTKLFLLLIIVATVCSAAKSSDNDDSNLKSHKKTKRVKVCNWVRVDQPKHKKKYKIVKVVVK